jgi:two-component sensor histidine kinase
MQHDWRGATLGELMRIQLEPFGGLDGTRIAASGPEVHLLSQATQSLGLIIHELATNATKHGALSIPGGSVAIEWTQDPSNQEIRLTWRENGGPPVELPERKGFGLVVFERIGGSLGNTSIDFRREGIFCVVTIGAANLHRSDSLAFSPHRFNAKHEQPDFG